MNFDDYQQQAAETAIYPQEHSVIYPALGLSGEAGEVANKVKKILRDDGGTLTDEKRAAIGRELGDCLWYIAAVARDLDLSLSEIAACNLQTLNSRKARGTLQGSGDSR